MRNIIELLTQFASEESGQDVVEYGILIATVAIVILISTSAFGTQITNWFNRLAGHITTTAT
jgi:Flp pilus assembly pilin Flp